MNVFFGIYGKHLKRTFAKKFTPSLEALRAQALVRSGKVDALGILSASVSPRTLVNVVAVAVARAGHAGRATAPEAAGRVDALGALGARVIRAFVNICVGGGVGACVVLFVLVACCARARWWC